jgi:transposase-like protein
MKHRRYTNELKLSVLAQLESGKSVAQICSEHNIGSSLLYKWKEQYKKDPHRAFSGNGNISSLESELKHCKKVIAELYLENDFLKKVRTNLQSLLSQQRLKKLEDSTK